MPHQQSTVAGARGRPLSAFILKCFMWGFDIYPAHEVKTFPAVFQSGVKLSCFVSYNRFRKWFFTGIVMKQSSSTCFLYSLLLYLLLLFVCLVDIYIWDKHNEINCYKDEGRLNRSSSTVKFITISCFHIYRTGGALIVSDEILCIRYISLCSPLEKTFALLWPLKIIMQKHIFELELKHVNHIFIWFLSASRRYCLGIKNDFQTQSKILCWKQPLCPITD